MQIMQAEHIVGMEINKSAVAAFTSDIKMESSGKKMKVLKYDNYKYGPCSQVILYSDHGLFLRSFSKNDKIKIRSSLVFGSDVNNDNINFQYFNWKTYMEIKGPGKIPFILKLGRILLSPSADAENSKQKNYCLKIMIILFFYILMGFMIPGIFDMVYDELEQVLNR